MANQKLSQLPAAAALAGTELIPIVQAGQTRIVTAAAVADLRKGTWQAATLTAPWANYGDAFAAAAYRKDSGRVQLRGLIKGGTGGTVALVLPVGFRPPTQHLYSVVCDLPGPTRVDIKPSGEVQITLPSSGLIGFLSLDTVAYWTD